MKDCEEMGEDREVTPFEIAIDAIVAGARKLLTLTENDPEDQPYQDDENFHCVSDSAFALRLSYRVWSETLGDQRHQEAVRREAQMQQMVFARDPAGMVSGGPTFDLMPLGKSYGPRHHKKARARRDEPAEQSEPYASLARGLAGLTPDDVDEFVKLFRERYEAKYGLSKPKRREPSDGEKAE